MSLNHNLTGPDSFDHQITFDHQPQIKKILEKGRAPCKELLNHLKKEAESGKGKKKKAASEDEEEEEEEEEAAAPVEVRVRVCE